MNTIHALAPSCPLCRAEGSYQVVDEGVWQVRACRACTNAWTDPPPRDVSYSVLDHHAATGGAESTLDTLPRVWRESIEAQVALLKRHLPAGARVLEIGCGAGILLGALRETGFVVVGLEPSHSATKRARDRGLNVYEGYFPSAEISAEEEPFAAVVMTHVLEHIGDPLDTLREVTSVAPGGMLLLVQTNWRGLVPRVCGAKWYAWAPQQHYWHFTPAGLMRVMQEVGLKPVACEYSILVPVGLLSRLICHVARLVPRWRDQFHLLSQLSVPRAGKI